MVFVREVCFKSKRPCILQNGEIADKYMSKTELCNKEVKKIKQNKTGRMNSPFFISKYLIKNRSVDNPGTGHKYRNSATTGEKSHERFEDDQKHTHANRNVFPFLCPVYKNGLHPSKQ